MKARVFFRHRVQLFLLFVAAFAIVYFVMSEILTSYFRQTLVTYHEKIALVIGKELQDNPHKEEWDRIAKTIGSTLQIRVTIIDSTGKVWGESEKNLEEVGWHYERLEFLEAMEKGLGSAERFSMTTREFYIYTAKKVEVMGEPIVVRIAENLNMVQSTQRQIRRYFLYTFLVVSFLIWVLSYLITHRQNLRLNSLLELIRELAEGKFPPETVVDDRGEFGIVAEELTKLVEAKEGVYQALLKEHEELQNIIEGIKEPLCVIDQNDDIVIENQAFRRNIKLDLKGISKFWGVIPLPQVGELVQQIRQSKKSGSINIIYNHHYYIVYGYYLELNKMILLVFQDISEQIHLREIKKNFVENISHELRTPLTSIAGYLENLEEDPDQARQFIPIILKNVRRMESLVSQITMMSEIDHLTEEKALKKEDVNLNRLLQSVIPLYMDQAKGKGLELIVEMPDHDLIVSGDEFLLEQMLSNLLENAIRYTDQGHVRLSLKREKDEVIIEVEDTGIGIPKEYQDRVFDRFFVVNRSRSRKAGGSGLGLAIVRNIVNLHGGRIHLESEPGSGSRFRIFLPAV